ncbi:GumC family protein [Thermodesulfobacteriota bacterium]
MNNIEEEQTIHLTEYYHLLLRNKWIIIISLVIAIGLALRYNAKLVPIYRATTTLIIDKETTRSPITGQPNSYESYLSESLSFNTHFELITSRPVLETVIRNLELDKMDKKQAKKEFIEISPIKQFLSRIKNNILLLFGRKKTPSPQADPHAGLAAALKGMVEIENVEDTRLLKINAVSPSPARARDVANGLAQAYIDFNITNRMKSSQNTLGWLTDRVYETKKRLEDAEEEFLAYKQDAKLISVEDKQKIISQKITDFNDAYLQARNQRLGLDAELEQLKKISQSGKNMPLPRSLVQNELIANLYSQRVQAELEFSRIKKVYKSKHPRFIQIQNQISQTQKKLNQEIRKELDNLEVEREVLLARESVLQKTIADFEKEGMETNTKELEYTILKRNVETNQQLYDALLTRIKEADIVGNVNVSNIRLTERARLPAAPIGPDRNRNLILSIVLGLIIGIGISFFRDYLDRSLRTEEDVRKYLGLPVLSVIPSADKGKQRMYSQGEGASNSEVKK